LKNSASIHRHDYPQWLLKNPQWIRLVWLWKRTIYPRTKVIRNRILIANKSIENSNHLNPIQVVDLGAGDGEFSFLWDAHSWILLDKSAQNVDFLNSFASQSRREFSNFHADVLDLDRSLKRVRSFLKSELATHRIFTLFSVLPYLDDPYRTLSEIGECMSQNDQLFIYLPVNQNQILPLYRWMFERFNQYEKQNDRKHIFKTTEFLNQLTSLGFEIRYVQPVYRKWGMISHEINSMTMMCLSHRNWGLKLMGTALLVLTWPFLQLFNKWEANTPTLWAKHNESNLSEPFTTEPFVGEVDGPISRANHLGSPISKRDVALVDLPIFQAKHNGLYVEVVKLVGFPGT